MKWNTALTLTVGMVVGLFVGISDAPAHPESDCPVCPEFECPPPPVCDCGTSPIFTAGSPAVVVQDPDEGDAAEEDAGQQQILEALEAIEAAEQYEAGR